MRLALVGAAQARRRYQFLDRDIAAQRLVVSQPDPAHAALAKGTDKPVPVGDTPGRVLTEVELLIHAHAPLPAQAHPGTPSRRSW
jgi:hypothetical protein